MKLYKLKDIDREVVLAKDVLSSDFQILLSSGTVLKKEYLNKLIDLGVEEVYINEVVKVDAVQIVLLKKEVEETFRKNVQTILEKHIYQQDSELQEIANTADQIITSILSEDNVIEKVYDIKERSADIYEHSISLCTLTTITALKLKLDIESIHDLGVACLLHDLGLRYLTISYENRNLDELDEFEYSEYKKHPVYAYSALKNEKWISEKSKNIILFHHEHLDGSGYPLRATDLPIEARIIGVCDAFDEMICGVGCIRTKVYEAVEYLKTFRDSFYDPKVVDSFLQFAAVYPVGTQVILNTGDMAIVIHQNAEFPERPVLRMIQDKNGNPIEEKKDIDLVKEHSIFINDVVN